MVRINYHSHFQKKDDKIDCWNYRGICFIQIVSKLQSIIILYRVPAARDHRTWEKQTSLCPGRGFVDQIFTLRQLCKMRYLYAWSMIMVFSWHSWRIRQCWQEPKNLNAVEIRRHLEGTMRVYGQLSFTYYSGVREGYPILPRLYKYVIDDVFRPAMNG